MKKKLNTEKEKELKSVIIRLEKELETLEIASENENILINLNNKKQELNEITDNKINGVLIRSKAEHVQSNDKNTKYYASLEKKKAESKAMSVLNINGKITQN